MKIITKRVFIAILTLTGWSNNANAQNVSIPDVNFKAALVSNSSINTNSDSEIQVSEASAFSGTINVNFLTIADLTGIEAFTAITSLFCESNQLTSLDVSANTALSDLWCSNNQLTSLVVPATATFTFLSCRGNQLTSLNVSGATSLSSLNCGNNQLASLNVSANTALTQFYCDNNQLTSLNVSTNTALNELDCYYNQLTSLNLPASTTLTQLRCYNNQLTSLNISVNTALFFLTCHNNQLTSLDASSNTALLTLICHYNQLTSLNVSGASALFDLGCSFNQLTSLDVSSNTALQGFSCSFNLLTSLDVSANTALVSLYCSYNQLTNLDVKNGNNTNFTSFDATNNPGLTCIRVDDATYMNTNWVGGKDAWASYNTNCTLGINESFARNNLFIFPNPSSAGTAVSYSLSNAADVTLEVYNAIGEKVATLVNERQNEGEHLYKFLPTKAGVYFVKLGTEKGAEMKKLTIVK